jgi:hypothetical protein
MIDEIGRDRRECKCSRPKTARLGGLFIDHERPASGAGAKQFGGTRRAAETSSATL